jgi:hypothetical protein
MLPITHRLIESRSATHYIVATGPLMHRGEPRGLSSTLRSDQKAEGHGPNCDLAHPTTRVGQLCQLKACATAPTVMVPCPLATRTDQIRLPNVVNQKNGSMARALAAPGMPMHETGQRLMQVRIGVPLHSQVPVSQYGHTKGHSHHHIEHPHSRPSAVPIFRP